MENSPKIKEKRILHGKSVAPGARFQIPIQMVEHKSVSKAFSISRDTNIYINAEYHLSESSSGIYPTAVILNSPPFLDPFLLIVSLAELIRVLRTECIVQEDEVDKGSDL